MNLIGRRLPGAAEAFPLVYRADEDLPLQQVHSRRGPAIRARRVLVLGTRKKESQRRQANMEKHEREPLPPLRRAPRAPHPQRETAQLAGLHAHRGLDQRRRVALPHAGQEPLGPYQQVAA